jgi:hypothetical protein
LVYLYNQFEFGILKNYLFKNFFKNYDVYFMFEKNIELFNNLGSMFINLKKNKKINNIKNKYISIILRILNISNILKNSKFEHGILIYYKIQNILSFILLNSKNKEFKLKNKKIKKHLIRSLFSFSNFINIKKYFKKFDNLETYKNKWYGLNTVRIVKKNRKIKLNKNKISIFKNSFLKIKTFTQTNINMLKVPLVKKTIKNDHFWQIEKKRLYKKSQKEFIYLKNKKKLKIKKKIINFIKYLKKERYYSLDFLDFIINKKKSLNKKLVEYVFNILEMNRSLLNPINNNFGNIILNYFLKSKKYNIKLNNNYYFLVNRFYKNNRQGIPNLFLSYKMDNTLNKKIKSKIEKIKLNSISNMSKYKIGKNTEFENLIILDQVNNVRNILKFRFYNSILNNKIKNNFLLNPLIINELTNSTKLNASIFQLLGELSPLIKKIELNSLNLFDVFTNIIKNTENSFLKHQ